MARLTCSATVITKRKRVSNERPVRADLQVQHAEQLALRQQRHADAGRGAELAGVLADQAALAVLDGVRPAAAQRPAVVHREDRRSSATGPHAATVSTRPLPAPITLIEPDSSGNSCRAIGSTTP